MKRRIRDRLIAAVLLVCSMVAVVPEATISAEQITVDENGVIEWDCEYTDNTYTHNNMFDGRHLIQGIDVSRWQEDIDWAKVKASGIDFAIIRVGHRSGRTGVIEEDLYYKKNIEEALANGINVGVYIFSQATTVKEARQEASYVLKRIKDYPITLPIVMDYEYDSTMSDGGRLQKAKLSKAKATKIVNAFCQKVQSAGYQPMVYANISMLTKQLKAKKLASQYPIWLARYNTYAEYDNPYQCWQYSSSGKVKGIDGRVDMDFWYLDTGAMVEKIQVTKQKENSVSLKWSTLLGANGYQIYRSKGTSKDYKLIADVSGNTYVDTGLKDTQKYNYVVRAYWNFGEKVYESADSAVSETSTKPAQVENLVVEQKKKTSLTIAWDEIARASGYFVYRSTKEDGSYKKIAAISAEEETIFTDTGLSSGKTYYYKVLAYKTVNGSKCKGKKSESLAVTTKKAKK